MTTVAFEAGQQAFQQDGTTKDDNPYEQDTYEYDEWLEGWQEQWAHWIDQMESQDWQDYLSEDQ